MMRRPCIGVAVILTFAVNVSIFPSREFAGRGGTVGARIVFTVGARKPSFCVIRPKAASPLTRIVGEMS